MGAKCTHPAAIALPVFSIYIHIHGLTSLLLKVVPRKHKKKKKKKKKSNVNLTGLISESRNFKSLKGL